MQTLAKRTRGPRQPRALDDEIAEAEANLAKLRVKKKEKERKDLERNEKAIVTLLISEGLNRVSIDQWQGAVAKLHELLDEKAEQKPKKEPRSKQPPATTSETGESVSTASQ